MAKRMNEEKLFVRWTSHWWCIPWLHVCSVQCSRISPSTSSSYYFKMMASSHLNTMPPRHDTYQSPYILHICTLPIFVKREVREIQIFVCVCVRLVYTRSGRWATLPIFNEPIDHRSFRMHSNGTRVSKSYHIHSKPNIVNYYYLHNANDAFMSCVCANISQTVLVITRTTKHQN